MAISLDEAEKLMKQSLFTGWDALRNAGEDAKSLSGKQIDITTKGDQIVGDAIIDFLRSKEMPLVIYTEEKGETDVNITKGPILSDDYDEFARVAELRSKSHSVVFDDIDGTKNFREGLNMLPHGTILGIFEGEDPTFEDCLAAGFLEFNSGNLFGAVRGQGAYVIEKFAYDQTKNKRQIHTSGRESIVGQKPLTLDLDIYMLGNFAPHFARYSGEKAWLGDFRSKAMHIADVAYGGADAFITADNCANPKKRATGEELGSGYLLIKEAGGSILSWDGYDLGKNKIGLGNKDTFDIIVASSDKLAKDLWERMNLVPEIEFYIQQKYYSGKK